MKIANGETSVGIPGQLVPPTEHVPIDKSRWQPILDAMRNLATGWDGYSAVPPTDTAIDLARLVLAEMEASGMPPTRLAPSVIGGVGLTQRIDMRKVYIEVRNDGRAYALMSNGEVSQALPIEISTEGLRDWNRLIAYFSRLSAFPAS
jgi:hypothetical protein